MNPIATRLLPIRPPVMRWCLSASWSWAFVMSPASTSISPIFLVSGCIGSQPFCVIGLQQVYIILYEAPYALGVKWIQHPNP